jgi:Fic family protein
LAKRIPAQELEAIEAIVRDHPDGIGAADIARKLETALPQRTLQYRLNYLVNNKRLMSKGERRWTKYRPPTEDSENAAVGDYTPASKQAAAIQQYVRKPIHERKPVGYNRKFLDAYRPNISAYLSEKERAHLQDVGAPTTVEQPAGTYSNRILNRLLIDLSWNSSRLEGNTYSLLDTKRLIAFGEKAKGKAGLEAQMILNHKDAIEFLVSSAEEIDFNRHTVLNLHALLANNLLAEPESAGRLRHIAVGIQKSTFHPLEVPQLIEECFEQILATTAAIRNPFEQSFFLMVQLPYLQPFDDVNKRVARLACNIPFIKANLTPLSFADVSTKKYTEAILGVYELNQFDLLKEVFIQAYERSASRYAAVRQSLGEPDPFILANRSGLRDVVGQVVRERMGKKSALSYIESWCRENVAPTEQEKFREVAETELLGLHEGNFARYRIKPSEFESWQEIWYGLQIEQ